MPASTQERTWASSPRYTTFRMQCLWVVWLNSSMRRFRRTTAFPIIPYIEYAAQSWDHARRVVVVVKPERTETGGYSRYYLVTNLPKAEYPGADMAVMYGRRGKAEMHQGEMKAAAVSMSLSSSPRAKSHYRNRIIQREEQTAQTEQAASGTVCRAPRRYAPAWPSATFLRA